METQSTAKRRCQNERTKGKKKDKVSTPYQASTPVKTEPMPACVTDTKVKPERDALVLPHVKPDIQTLGNTETGESFATRIAKGSGWILIDEYSAPKSPSRNGKRTNSHTKCNSDKHPDKNGQPT